MTTRLDIDQIHAMQAALQTPEAETSVPQVHRQYFKKYFAPMGISEPEKKRRIMLAEELDLFMLILLLALMEDEYNNALLAEQYAQLAAKHLKMDQTPAYIIDHARDYVDNFKIATDEHVGEDYFWSDERLMLNAANEANVIENYGAQVAATKVGKKYKTWLSAADERVRLAHAEVDGMMVGISDPFVVGGYYMMFPGDDSLGAGPEQIINCRCILAYS